MSTKENDADLVALYKKLGLELRYYPSSSGSAVFKSQTYEECVAACQTLNKMFINKDVSYLYEPTAAEPDLSSESAYIWFLDTIFNRDDFDEKTFVRNLIGDTIFESIHQPTADAHLVYAVAKALTSSKDDVINAVCRAYDI